MSDLKNHATKTNWYWYDWIGSHTPAMKKWLKQRLAKNRRRDQQRELKKGE